MWEDTAPEGVQYCEGSLYELWSMFSSLSGYHGEGTINTVENIQFGGGKAYKHTGCYPNCTCGFPQQY